MTWQLAEAKNRFSEVVSLALTKGPQRITRRDEAVLVIAESEYEKLTGRKKSFKDILMGDGPDQDGLDMTRDRSTARDIAL